MAFGTMKCGSARHCLNNDLNFTTEDTEDTEVFNKFKSVVSVIQKALARRISSPCIQCAILIEE